jgi:hypothetical protein
MPAHPLGSANTQRERYICPICNIGSGQEKRSYNRRFSNNESPEAKFSFNTSHPPNMPKLYKNEFQIPSAFNRHLTGWHARVFQSINSSEYICSLCPCDCVMGRTLVCSARYPADSSEAKQRFLDHLRDAHAQTPETLVWYPHQCPPAMKEYYTNPEVRKVAESIP